MSLSEIVWLFLVVKVKLSLCLTKHYTIKAYWGVDVYIHIFLTSALAEGEWSASRPGRLIQGEEPPVPTG
jgi:hypothetical protein